MSREIVINAAKHESRIAVLDDGQVVELWVERTGVRSYTGRSTRGAEVLVGNEDVDGVFTPGELMKIALAACSGMASDAPLRRRLGDVVR